MTANALIVDGIKNCNFTRSGKLYELLRFNVEIKKIVLYDIIIVSRYLNERGFVENILQIDVIIVRSWNYDIIDKVQIQNFV